MCQVLLTEHSHLSCCISTGRSAAGFLKCKATVETLTQLASELQRPQSELVCHNCGLFSTSGTWVHPRLLSCAISYGSSLSGFLYLASSRILNAVKIGRWKGNLDKLRKRYSTPYGPTLQLHMVYVGDCHKAESAMHCKFCSSNLGGELFSKELMHRYVEALEEYSTDKIHVSFSDGAITD